MKKWGNGELEGDIKEYLKDKSVHASDIRV